MGNEFTEEKGPKEIDPVEYSDDYVKYSIISQKGEERAIDDAYLSLPNLTSPEEAKKRINFSLFGVFDGHNDNYVSKYLSENCKEIFEKEAGEINKDNCQDIIEKIFKTIDKNLREVKNNNLKNEENKEEEKYISDDIDNKEIEFYKKLIKDSKEIPEDLKNVEDSQIKNLLLFRNLFKYNNNYLYSNNDPDYIGSSASIIMINNENIFTADLGITKCILFNSEGKILNKGIEKENEQEKENELFKFEHVFENKSEKKRIKRFNESIDYEKLKLNIYLPTSRCFGLFKYKADEILKEENQIISCVPKVNFYTKDDVDFILLMTKGMINLLKGKLKEFIKKIVEIFQKKEEKDIKISEEIKKYINKRLEEKEKEKEKDDKEKNKEDKKPMVAAKSNPIYVGKEDFEEENEIINELKKNYYRDIMEMNKNSSHNCHDKYNITCIVMKISKNKKPIIEVKMKEKEKKKEIEKKEVKEEIEKKVENDKKEDEKKLEEKDNKDNIEKEGEKENKEEQKKNEENIIEKNELPANEEKKDNNEEEKDELKKEVEENKEENKLENNDNEKKGENEEIKLEDKEEKNEIKEISKVNDMNDENKEEKKENNKENEKKDEKNDKLENDDKKEEENNK